MRIYYGNQIDPSGIEMSASSAAFDSSSNYAANPLRKVMWKSGTASASEYLSVHFSTAKQISSLVLVDHNFVPGDVLTLKADNAGTFSSPIVNQSVAITSGIIAITFTPATCSYWRLFITKPSAGVTRSVGVMMLGTYYDTPEQPDDRGYDEELVDLSKTSKSMGGQMYVELLPTYSKVTTKFSMIDQSFMDALGTIFATNGTGRAVLFQVESSGALSKYWYARMMSPLSRKVSAFDTTSRYDTKLEFEELL